MEYTRRQLSQGHAGNLESPQILLDNREEKLFVSSIQGKSKGYWRIRSLLPYVTPSGEPRETTGDRQLLRVEQGKPALLSLSTISCTSFL